MRYGRDYYGSRRRGIFSMSAGNMKYMDVFRKLGFSAKERELLKELYEEGHGTEWKTFPEFANLAQDELGFDDATRSKLLRGIAASYRHREYLMSGSNAYDSPYVNEDDPFESWFYRVQKFMEQDKDYFGVNDYVSLSSPPYGYRPDFDSFVESLFEEGVSPREAALDIMDRYRGVSSSVGRRDSRFGERSWLFSAREEISDEEYVKRARKGAESINKWLADNMWGGAYKKSYGGYVHGYEDCYLEDYYPFSRVNFPRDPEGSGRVWAQYVSTDRNFFVDFYWEAIDIIEAKHPETIEFLSWYNSSGKSQKKMGDSDIGWYQFKDYLLKGLSPRQYAQSYLYEYIEEEKYWDAYKTCRPWFSPDPPAPDRLPEKRKGDPSVSVKWKNRAIKTLAEMYGGSVETAKDVYSWYNPEYIYEVSDECPSPMSYPLTPETWAKTIYAICEMRTPSYPCDLSSLVGKF